MEALRLACGLDHVDIQKTNTKHTTSKMCCQLLLLVRFAFCWCHFGGLPPQVQALQRHQEWLSWGTGFMRKAPKWPPRSTKFAKHTPARHVETNDYIILYPMGSKANMQVLHSPAINVKVIVFHDQKLPSHASISSTPVPPFATRRAAQDLAASVGHKKGEKWPAMAGLQRCFGTFLDFNHLQSLNLWAFAICGLQLLHFAIHCLGWSCCICLQVAWDVHLFNLFDLFISCSIRYVFGRNGYCCWWRYFCWCWRWYWCGSCMVMLCFCWWRCGCCWCWYCWWYVVILRCDVCSGDCSCPCCSHCCHCLGRGCFCCFCCCCCCCCCCPCRCRQCCCCGRFCFCWVVKNNGERHSPPISKKQRNRKSRAEKQEAEKQTSKNNSLNKTNIVPAPIIWFAHCSFYKYIHM